MTIWVVGKDGGGGRIGESDLKFNHINDIQFDRENKQIQIYYHDFNIVPWSTYSNKYKIFSLNLKS